MFKNKPISYLMNMGAKEDFSIRDPKAKFFPPHFFWNFFGSAKIKA
jgi:hypothetical protein